MINDARPFTYIQTNDALAVFLRNIQSASLVAVDTEFVRDGTYFSKLSTLQMATENDVVLIDALAPKLDLSPLKEVFQRQTLKKIFHAGRQDLEIFYNLWGIVPTPIADTQVMAMVQGFGDSVGYQSLVKSLLKKDLSKAHRLSDWSRRPLSPEQIQYAAGDVVHLIALYEKLEKPISARLSWIEEEMEILSNPKTYAPSPLDAWRRLPLQTPVSVQTFSKVQALAKWREEEAIRSDKPRTHILEDIVLIDIAQSSSPQKAILHRMQKNPEKKRYELALLECIENAPLDIMVPSFLQEVPPPTKIQEVFLLDVLKVLHKMASQKHRVAPKLIGSVDDLKSLIQNPSSQSKILQGWRYEIFGKDAFDFLQGRSCLKNQRGNLEISALQ